MDDARFDDLTRFLTGGRTRRGLGRLLGGLLLGGPLASSLDPAQAKKKANDNDKKKSCPSCKKKKDGKCKANKPDGTTCENGGTCQNGNCVSAGQVPPTCAATCQAPCSTCYTRPTGSVLCGGPGGADCKLPCSSDNDCVGTVRPFCTSSFTDRATGETFSWGCPGDPRGVCTAVDACSP